MLTPDYMKDLPKELLKYYGELEDKVLKDIVRRLDGIDELPVTATGRIESMVSLGYDLRDLLEEIENYSGLGTEKFEELIKKAGLLSYINDQDLYKLGNKTLKNYEDNPIIGNLVKSSQKLGVNDLTNITRTLGLNGEPLEEYYRKKLSESVIAVHSGVFSKEEILRKTIQTLGDKGLQTIGYRDRNYTIESAVRMCINSTVNQMSSAMGLINAEDMGQDLMELTAHMGARPSHADWQGKIVSLSGRSGYLDLSDIGYGDAGGFMGVNCRHNWYPFFEGISNRAYTNEMLKSYDPDPFTYRGKKYTYYEATQRQRQLERSIRQSKRKILMYNEANDEEMLLIEKVKLQRKRQEYSKFTRASGMKKRNDRTRIYSA